MRRRGFTLIELLIVIVVIALLMAIAVPALQKSKKRGTDLLCTSNLRQLSLGISVYLQDNQSYPYGFCSIQSISINDKLGDSIKDWQKGWWWFSFLDNTVTDNDNQNRCLWCPSRRYLMSDSSISNNVLCGNYGINYAICKITASSIISTEEFCGDPLRSEQIHNPSSKLLLADSGYSLISWKALVPNVSDHPFEQAARQDSYYLPGLSSNRDRLIAPIQRDDADNGRHESGMFNAAFSDGHVDKRNPSSVAPRIDSAERVSKNSPWRP